MREQEVPQICHHRERESGSEFGNGVFFQKDMEKEEKALESTLDTLINRAQDLSNSISALILKIENEYQTLNWPDVLDSYATLSGQLSTLLKIIKNEKLPILRNRVLLPVLVSPDRNEELAKLTENRLQCFNHEIVPDLLRTKADPDVEACEHQFQAKANVIPIETAQKQITAVNKIVNNILDMVKAHRDSWESESGQRANANQSSFLANTSFLVSAVTFGKCFRPQSGSPKGQSSNFQPLSQLPQRPDKEDPRDVDNRIHPHLVGTWFLGHNRPV